MQQTPNLTDRTALRHHRARALRHPAPALFLQEDAADEIKERLNEVNRRFTSPAIVTPFPQIWQDRLPGAVIVGDDDTLTLQPGAHDLVIHALCLHWANDPVGQLIQCRRALKPDGLLMATLFGGQTLAELRAVLAEAETAVSGGLSPRVAPMGEIRDLGALLQRAGFGLPVADTALRSVRYRDLMHLMHDLRAMGETNALAQRHKRPASRALFARAAQLYATHFAGPDGRIPASFEVVCLTGWAPDDSQPKPLRPGSAAMRLADALGTEETTLPDPAPKRPV